MKTKTTYWLAALALVAVIALSLLGGNSATALAGGPSKPNGSAYPLWSARWWQWAFSLPVHNPPCAGKPCTNDIYNPLFVNGAADCSLGQTGKVWFIGGVYGISGTPIRTCTIPRDTALFFPVLNSLVDNVATDPPMTVAQLRAAAADYMDKATELHAIIDGTSVPNLSSYRAKSPIFAYVFPAQDNVYQWVYDADVPGTAWPSTTVFPAVSDGYWLFVPPLPLGPHTLTFGGTIGEPYNFSTEVIYHITVTTSP